MYDVMTGRLPADPLPSGAAARPTVAWQRQGRGRGAIDRLVAPSGAPRRPWK